MTELDLFRSGLCTLSIAKNLGITEGEAYNRIHHQRTAEIEAKRVAAYRERRKHFPKRSSPVPYAGAEAR